MAFDVRDGEVVLFGGFGAGSQPLSGTWTYANGSWTHARTNESPPARAAAAMAYDPVSNQVVLFGGHGASGPLADTWTFSNGNWTNITPTTAASPPKRYDASFAWDVSDQMAVLFGGRNYLGVLNDTWVYANGTWVNLTASAAGASGTPSQRYSASFGFDYSDDAVVLFGGDGTIAATGGLLGDTWWFRGGHWVLPTTASAPAARTGSAIAFDASEASLVLFGGQPSGAAPLNDAWTYANGNWSGPIATSGPAPNPRTGAALVACAGPTPATSFVLLFGGSPTNASLSNDTWIFGSESIVGVFVEPSREGVDLLQNVTFSAVPVGGTPPYSYAWTGNPPPLSAGCGSPTAPTIRCQLPTLGKFGVWVNVSEASGGPATAGFGFVTVTAAPSIPSLTVKPFPYHLGAGNVTITAVVVGGAHPLTFVYSGLPPGCATVNATTVSCAPIAIGDFTVTLNVSDGAGEFNSSQAALVVDPAQGKTGWTSRDTVLAAAAGVGVVAILAIVYWRRGSRRSPDSGDGPPTDTR